MSDTPITDRALAESCDLGTFQDFVMEKTCRELDRVANRMYEAITNIKTVGVWVGPRVDKALAAFEAMKGTT